VTYKQARINLFLSNLICSGNRRPDSIEMFVANYRVENYAENGRSVLIDSYLRGEGK